jgi:hypothetical protein
VFCQASALRELPPYINNPNRAALLAQSCNLMRLDFPANLPYKSVPAENKYSAVLSLLQRLVREICN